MSAAVEEGFHPSQLLYLFLGLETQLTVDSLLYLTVADLAPLLCLGRDLRFALLERFEYRKCRDGLTYKFPFPGFPAVLETPNDLKRKAGLFPHQLASLRAMQRIENCDLNADVDFLTLRGGILADAPGLGKTITALSLVASTAGRLPRAPTYSKFNYSKVQEGWHCMRTNASMREDMNRVFRRLVQHNWKNHDVLQLAREAELPWDDDRFATPQQFQTYMLRELRKSVGTTDRELWLADFRNFLIKLDKTQRAFFSSKDGQRFLLEYSMYRSIATLIIAPDALLEHWYVNARQSCAKTKLKLACTIFFSQKVRAIQAAYGSSAFL